jgi:hypothetical protein
MPELRAVAVHSRSTQRLFAGCGEALRGPKSRRVNAATVAGEKQ